MWIFCKLGFFSAVEHRERPDNLLIRARFKGDLERLYKAMDQISRSECGPIQETPDADYRYRMECPKIWFSEVLREQAEEIDYDNFKNAVHEGTVRDGAYMDVWRALWAAQNFGKNRKKVV